MVSGEIVATSSGRERYFGLKRLVDGVSIVSWVVVRRFKDVKSIEIIIAFIIILNFLESLSNINSEHESTQ